MQLLVLTLLSLSTATLALVHYPNGAAVPYNDALLAATNAHLASKGYLGYPFFGLHQPAYLGRKRRDAEPSADPFLAYGLPWYPYFTPLVAHPNGAVVPLESVEIIKARAEHLAAVAAASK